MPEQIYLNFITFRSITDDDVLRSIFKSENSFSIIEAIGRAILNAIIPPSADNSKYSNRRADSETYNTEQKSSFDEGKKYFNLMLI